MVELNALNLLVEGKAEFERRKNRKADISKTILNKSLVICTKQSFKDAGLREQEVYDFVFCCFYSVIKSRSELYTKEALMNFKSYSKKELKNLKTSYDSVLIEIAELYEKSAFNIPSYKMKRNHVYKKAIKDFHMKDLIMGVAMAQYKYSLDYSENIEDSQSTIHFAILFMFALLSLEDYNTINSILTYLHKTGDIRKFECKFTSVLRDIIYSFALTKGKNIQFEQLEEYESIDILLEEHDEKVNTIIQEYTKLIDDLKKENSSLKEEINKLKEDNKRKQDYINELKGYKKLDNQTVLLIAHKGDRDKYTEILYQYKAKSVIILDPFDDTSRIGEIARNVDVVFHMTDNTSHTVSNILKSVNANVVLINKTGIRYLEETINNL